MVTSIKTDVDSCDVTFWPNDVSIVCLYARPSQIGLVKTGVHHKCWGPWLNLTWYRKPGSNVVSVHRMSQRPSNLTGGLLSTLRIVGADVLRILFEMMFADFSRSVVIYWPATLLALAVCSGSVTNSLARDWEQNSETWNK